MAQPKTYRAIIVLEELEPTEDRQKRPPVAVEGMRFNVEGNIGHVVQRVRKFADTIEVSYKDEATEQKVG